MSPKWFRRGKNCFIAASWATESGPRLAVPDPAGDVFIDLFQSFIREAGLALCSDQNTSIVGKRGSSVM